MAAIPILTFQKLERILAVYCFFLNRSDYNYSEVADGIKDTITLFADKTDKEVKEIRKRAAEVAEQALWKHFIQYYYEAYDIALRKARIRQLS